MFSAITIFAQLTRLDAAVIIYLALLLPITYASRDLFFASTHALPLAVIAMSGFVINNLYDAEKDKINHPERPLPSGRINPVAAGALYFILLATSLTLVHIYADGTNHFLYLLLLLSTANYNVAIAYFPYTKNIYVAAIGVASAMIALTIADSLPSHIYVLCAVFFYLLGKEMLMDILDEKADGMTLVKLIGIERSEGLAFGLKVIADAFLMAQASNFVGATLAVALLISDIGGAWLWKVGKSKTPTLVVMKCQAVLGIYFLL